MRFLRRFEVRQMSISSLKGRRAAADPRRTSKPVEAPRHTNRAFESVFVARFANSIAVCVVDQRCRIRPDSRHQNNGSDAKLIRFPGEIIRSGSREFERHFVRRSAAQAPLLRVNSVLRQGLAPSSEGHDSLLMAVRPMAAVPHPKPSHAAFFPRRQGGSSRPLRCKKGACFRCAAALRPKGSDAGRPP